MHQTLCGKYGRDEGKYAGPHESLACEQSPVLMHFQCRTTFCVKPIDQSYVSNCYTYNGVSGRALGIGPVKADKDEPDKYCVDIKTIVTFGALCITQCYCYELYSALQMLHSN